MQQEESKIEQAKEMAKEQAKEMAKKKIKQAILKAILPYLPFIIGAIIVIVVVVMIALAIVGMVSKYGTAGKTEFQPTEQGNPDHEKTKNKVLSLAGDTEATASVATSVAEILIETASKCRAQAEEAGDQKAKEQLLIIEGTIQTMGTSEANSALRSAQTSIGQIDQILKSNDPDYQKYKECFEKLLKGMQEAESSFITIASPRLVIASKDLYYIRTYQVDIKILKALEYLATPIPEGGAGYQKIKIRRIKREYDSEGRKYTREWEEDEDEERSESAHFSGQAMDISVINQVQRRIIKKRRVGGSKTEKRPPVDILVYNQSREVGSGYGSSTSSTGNTFGQLFESGAMRSLLGTLSEDMGYDLANAEIDAGSFPQIAKSLGLAILAQETGTIIDSKKDNSSLEKLAYNIGQKIVADYFNISEEALKGNSGDQIRENLGREEAAKKLKIEPGSLFGNTSDEILTSVGKRKVEKNLGIKRNSLDHLGNNEFPVFAGQVLIEEKLNLPGGSMSSGTLNNAKSTIGEEKFNKAFSANNPNVTDSLLGITIGSTANLLKGGIALSAYKRAVGNELIKTKVTNFTRAGADYRDEIFDAPNNSVNRITSNNYTAFYDMGVDEIAKRLTDDETERQVLRLWFSQYKNLALEDFRYTFSDILQKPIIKTINQVKNPDQNRINQLKQQITQKNISIIRTYYSPNSEDYIKDLIGEYRVIPDFSSANSIRANQKQLDEQIKKVEKARCPFGINLCGPSSPIITNLNDLKDLMEELKWEMMPEEIEIPEGASEEEITELRKNTWSKITENYFNDSYGLPPGAVSRIFIKSQGSELFDRVGSSKANSLSRTSPLPQIRADLNFYYEQLKKEGGESKRQLWEDMIAIKENEAEEILNSQSAVKKAKTYITGDKEELIKDIFFRDSNLLSNILSYLGASQLEETLNLPEESLQKQVIKYIDTSRENVSEIENEDPDNPLSPEEIEKIEEEEKAVTPRKKTEPLAELKRKTSISGIGAEFIEKTLGMPSNSFSGESISEVTIKAGGREKLLSYFAPNYNPQDLAKRIDEGENEENTKFFKNIFSETDRKLGLKEGSTYSLIIGPGGEKDLSPDQYSEQTGKTYIKDKATGSLTANLNLEVLGYKLTENDINDIINGNFLETALKIGGKNLDEAINLPAGTMKSFLKNPDENSLKAVLAVAGQEKLANYMGIYGKVSLSGNIKENIGQAKIEETLDPSGALPAGWFNGSDIDDVVNNVIRLRASLGQGGASTQELFARTKAEILSVFGNPTSVDEKLKITKGTTENLLAKKITVGEYKEKVAARHTQDQVSGWLCDEALSGIGGDAKNIMNKYGLGCEDLREGIKDPDKLINKAIFSFLSPTEIYALTGLGVKLPIKGEFPDNVAQKQVEELLGLAEGSFSPSNSIQKVMEINGGKRFANAFRLYIPGSTTSDSDIKSYLSQNALGQNPSYWDDSRSIIKIQYIDNMLKIAQEGRSPTRELLQRIISVNDYLELVKTNQFNKLDINGFLGFLASREETESKIRQYLGPAGVVLNLIKDPKSFKDPSTRLQLLESLKTFGNIDLDDRMGFDPGTMENIILNPKEAKSILTAQGIKAISKNVFGDNEAIANNLTTLFGYFTNINSQYNENTRPGSRTSSISIESCNLSLTREEKKFYADTDSFSKCLIHSTAKDLLKEATAIKDDNGNLIAAGISLPDRDLVNLLKGDMKVFASLSFAFSVNEINTKEDGKGGIKLLPPGFQLSYDEIRDAMWGGPELQEKVKDKAIGQYKKDHGTLPDIQFAPKEYGEYLRGQDEAIKKAQENAVPNARKELQFKYLDAQLASAITANNDFPQIPAGFTQTMFQGDNKERNNMLVNYGVSYVISNELLPGDLRQSTTVQNAINAYIADPNKDFDKFKDNLLNQESIRGEIFGVIDKKFAGDIAGKFDFPIPTAGIAENLYSFATTGELKPDFIDDWEAAGRNYIGGVVDEGLGLPTGTTQRTYDVYKKYDAGQISKGDAIVLAATIVFGKELAKIDQSLGLPPGSLSSVVSAIIIGGPIAIAMAIFTIAFGVYKVEAQATCPQDTLSQALPNYSHPMAYVSYGRWCNDNQGVYTRWAQINTRNIIYDMMIIGKSTKDNNLVPTVIGTFRDVDVDYFKGEESGNLEDKILREILPSEVPKGFRGIHQSDYMKEFVHIGY